MVRFEGFIWLLVACCGVIHGPPAVTTLFHRVTSTKTLISTT